MLSEVDIRQVAVTCAASPFVLAIPHHLSNSEAASALEQQQSCEFLTILEAMWERSQQALPSPEMCGQHSQLASNQSL